MCLNLFCFYHYKLATVAGMPIGDSFDLEMETEEGAGLLPGVGIVPTEILAL